MEVVLKKFLILTLLVAVAAFTFPAVTQAETVRLSYSNFFPPTHVQSKVAEQWCKEVEKRTGGQVVVDYYPGCTLTKANQCYDGVVEGMSDIGLSALAYTRGRFPVMAAVDLPLGYTSGVQATQAANQVYEKFKPKEFDDVEIMYFHAHGPGILFTAKKPVKNLQDLKGMKIRATGNSGQLINALGGTAVAMSMPDSYQAIQKGVVQGGIYPMETNKGWKMAEVVDYCTETYPVAYTTTFFVAMNKDKWNSLPDDVKKTIREINAEWALKHGQAWDESDKVGREFLTAKGGKFITLSDEQAAEFVEAAKPMMDEYVKDAKKKGFNGQEVLDYTKSCLN